MKSSLKRVFGAPHRLYSLPIYFGCCSTLLGGRSLSSGGCNPSKSLLRLLLLTTVANASHSSSDMQRLLLGWCLGECTITSVLNYILECFYRSLFWQFLLFLNYSKSELFDFFQLFSFDSEYRFFKIQIFCSAVTVSVGIKFLKLPTTIQF